MTEVEQPLNATQHKHLVVEYESVYGSTTESEVEVDRLETSNGGVILYVVDDGTERRLVWDSEGSVSYASKRGDGWMTISEDGTVAVLRAVERSPSEMVESEEDDEDDESEPESEEPKEARGWVRPDELRHGDPIKVQYQHGDGWETAFIGIYLTRENLPSTDGPASLIRRFDTGEHTHIHLTDRDTRAVMASEEEVEEISDETEEEDGEVDLDQLRETAERLGDLGILSEPQAAVYLAREVHGMGRSETAEALGMAASTTDTHRQRARPKVEDLRETLDLLDGYESVANGGSN